MTTTPKVLIEMKYAETVQTTQYTSTNCKTFVDKITATNNTAANATLTVNLVPPAGAVAAANAITKVVAPGTTWPFPDIVGHLLESGGFISTIAGTANAIELRSTGRQVT